MNMDRRARISKLIQALEGIKTDIEELQSEEQEAFDGMPESLQSSEKGQASEASADALQMAADGFDEITTALEEAIN